MDNIEKAVEEATMKDDKFRFRDSLNLEDLKQHSFDDGGVNEFVNNPTTEGIKLLDEVLTPVQFKSSR